MNDKTAVRWANCDMYGEAGAAPRMDRNSDNPRLRPW